MNKMKMNNWNIFEHAGRYMGVKPNRSKVFVAANRTKISISGDLYEELGRPKEVAFGTQEGDSSTFAIINADRPGFDRTQKRAVREPKHAGLVATVACKTFLSQPMFEGRGGVGYEARYEAAEGNLFDDVIVVDLGAPL